MCCTGFGVFNEVNDGKATGALLKKELRGSVDRKLDWRYQTMRASKQTALEREWRKRAKDEVGPKL
jgi:hypothetical protein